MLTLIGLAVLALAGYLVWKNFSTIEPAVEAEVTKVEAEVVAKVTGKTANTAGK